MTCETNLAYCFFVNKVFWNIATSFVYILSMVAFEVKDLS